MGENIVIKSKERSVLITLLFSVILYGLILFYADFDVVFLVKHPKKKVGYWDDPDFPDWYYEA